MSFDIEELKIKFLTNIKSAEYRTIEFKRSMLYHPEIEKIEEILNEYPYFTADLKYPISRLRYLTYSERVTFFFNKEKFNERLSIYSKEKNFLDKNSIKTDEDEEKYYNQRKTNIEKNIMIMIEVLFPTKFPVINDIQPSYDFVFDKGKFKRMILNPRVTKYFSYVKLGDNIYTFKKTMWINDILNHPTYQVLFAQYRKLSSWANDEKFKYRKMASKVYPALATEIIQFNNATKELNDNTEMKQLNNATEELNDNTEMKQLFALFNINNTADSQIDNFKMAMNLIGKIAEAKTEEKAKTLSTIMDGPSVKAFKKALDLYGFTESLFTQTFSEVTESAAKLGIQLASQYNNFSYAILGRYRAPASESTNVELQELINCADSEKTKEFYEFMNYVYNRYIFVGSKKKPKNNDHFDKIMNVGLTLLSTNTTEGLHREIYMYTDFIKGEVNDANKGKIFCPFVSDHLGNEFELLVRAAMYGKASVQRGNIDRNRMIFSITEGKSENAVGGAEKPLELTAEPLPQQLVAPVPEQKKHLDSLPTTFSTEIIAANKQELNQSMENVNKISPNDGLNDQTLLVYLKKNEPDLYNIVVDWNENMGKKDFKLLEKMSGLKAKYTGANDSLELEKDDLRVKSDGSKQVQIEYKLVKNKLYILLLEKLIANESAKVQVVGGFSRKQRRRLMGNYTRKSSRVY